MIAPFGGGGGGGMHFFFWGASDRGKKPPSLTVYRRLLRFAAPYKWHLVVAGVLLLASTALTLLWPQFVRAVLDDGLHDPGLLDGLVLLLVLVLLVRSAIDGVRGFVMAYTGERVIFDLRVAIVRHLHSLSLSFFNERKSGELLSHVTTDATIVHSVVTQTILSVIGQVLTLVGGLAIIFVMNWRLALLTLVVAPPIALIGRWMGGRIRKISRAAQDAQAEAIGVLQESLAEMRTVQAFTREPYELGRFEDRLRHYFVQTLRRARLGNTMFPLIGFLGFASSIVVLWYGGHQIAAGEATAGEIVAFLLYMGQVSGPIGGLAGQWAQIQEAFGAADRLFALLDTKPTVVERPDARPLPPGPAEIAFERVSFKYDTPPFATPSPDAVAEVGPRMMLFRRGSAEPTVREAQRHRPENPLVLADVTTRIGAGTTTALVGPSGAGKTTFVNLIGRFYDPTSGRITVDGHDLRDVTVRSLRERIAVVPQEPILFAATIKENIRYGRLEATDEEILAAARAANAVEFIERLPSGIDTLVGERGVKLSVGQRQRVAIARAILRDARVLLLDEATSSLDNESEYLVQQALARLTRGRTTIVIAHRLTTVERADRILVLERGRLVEEGTHAELLAKSGLYRRLYERLFLEREDEDAEEPEAMTGTLRRIGPA